MNNLQIDIQLINEPSLSKPCRGTFRWDVFQLRQLKSCSEIPVYSSIPSSQHLPPPKKKTTKKLKQIKSKKQKTNQKQKKTNEK